MYDENSQLVQSFASTIDALNVYPVDYRIAAAVQDNGCILGPDLYIDNTFSSQNASEAIETMADMNYLHSSYGSLEEKGFSIAANALAATGPGSCNQGFYRQDTIRRTGDLTDGRRIATICIIYIRKGQGNRAAIG